jgi:hypothetical protein
VTDPGRALLRRRPPVLISQTGQPGGKILLTLSGWLYRYARVLLTVADDVTAEGPLLPGAARSGSRPPPGSRSTCGSSPSARCQRRR